MRIACLHLPSLPVQAHLRRAPHLGGAALAIRSLPAKGHPATVLGCSRAAHQAGVRSGMRASAAAALCPGLVLVDADEGLYRDTVAALGESLLRHATAVDIFGASTDGSPHRSIYLRVPPRIRGETFAHAVLTDVTRQGFSARIGVADDRFTAHLAASVGPRGHAAEAPPCTVVPRGCSAGFLAPLDVALLGMEAPAQALLRSAGVRTIGDFAALPPPTSTMSSRIVDYQALARGDGPTSLHHYAPRSTIVERVDLEPAVGSAEPLAFVARLLCDRVGERLCGRGSAAEGVALELIDRAGGSQTLAVDLDTPSAAPRALLDALRPRLSGDAATAVIAPNAPIVALVLRVVHEAEPVAAELPLFSESQLGRLPRPRPDAEVLDRAIARVEARTHGRPTAPRRTRRHPRHGAVEQPTLAGILD